jgi:hypothetical protein
MTDSEKLDKINERLKRVERNSHIHLAIVVIGFLGIVSLKSLIGKVKALK